MNTRAHVSKLLFAVLIVAVVVTASAARANEEPARPAKKTTATQPAPTFADVAYDVHKRTKLDFWQAEGAGPRPVHVFIHGGGWVQGDKSRKLKDVSSYLAKGISMAAINYRYSVTDPLPAPVHDAVRAIQFLRSKAKDWNIDKNKFVLSGSSAGGCTSLIIACHDDFAKPDSDDPVERESSRVQGAAVVGAQSSIDPKQIEPWIGPNVYHKMIYHAVGEESIEAALRNYAKHEATYKEFSAYNHLTKDDPPLFLRYRADLTVPAKSFGHGIHHGMFGLKMKEKSAAVGHDQVYLVIGPKKPGDVYANDEAFITSILLGK